MGSNLTHTINGYNLIQLKTMDNSNIEHLKVHFLPQQEGSGDPSPSNVRNITGRTSIGYHYGSKNIFSSTHLNKTAYNIRPYYDEPITLPAGTYTMSCSEECDGIYVNEGNEAIFTVYHKTSMTFTLTATKTIWFNFYKADGMPDYATVQLETGSQPTLPMTGKNLFDRNNATIIDGYFQPDVNYVITTSSYSKCVVFPCQPNTQYTISKMSSSRLRVGDCSTLNPTIGDTVTNYTHADSESSVTHTTGADAKNMIIWVYNRNFDTMTIEDILKTLQIEYGSVATTYQQYLSTFTITQTFPISENSPVSLYGGYIDAITGAVIAEYKEIVNTTWDEGTTATEFTNVERRYFTFTDNVLAPGSGDIQAQYRFCNVAKWSWDYNKDSIHYYTDNDYKTAYVFLPLNTPGDTPIRIVEKLATPITIGYVNTASIKTYEGITNIQSNANGKIECTYRFTDYLAPRRILINTPHIETVSNNLATFDTDMAAKIKSLKCSFTPQQSGSGNPYAPGGGKNLFNPESTDTELSNTTTIYNQNGAKSVRIPASEGQVYYLSIKETATGVLQLTYVDDSDNILTRTGVYADTYRAIGLEAPANTAALIASISDWSAVSEVQLEQGNSATAYAPYSNIRPITGHSDITGYINTQAYNINFPVLGRNLFDKSTGIQLASTTIRAAREENKGIPFLMKGGVTYTVSTNSSTTPSEIDILVPYATTRLAYVYSKSYVTYTPSEDTLVALNAYWQSGRPADANDFQIEIGSSSHPYWPFFKIADGYINLITGELVVNSILLTYNTANMNNHEGFPGWAQSGVAQIVGTNLDTTYWNYFTMNIGGTFSVNTKYSDILFIPKSVYGFTQTEWQALAMDIQLCVPYTTPQVIQLTPQQIKTIKGSNTIYSSTGDNVSVEYWTH